MRVINCDQRSPEWKAARCGKLTASRAGDMTATIQKGEAAARRHLRTQLVLERLTGVSQDSGFTNQAMQQGTEREPDAVLWYEAETGQIVQRTGFIEHDEFAAGASLDGHVGDFEGLIECKCPLASTHLEFLETGKIPGGYLDQITHQLWIAGAQWCDFVSFHPDFPDGLRLKIVRVTRDERAIRDYEAKALAFLAEVDQKVAALRTLTDLRGTLSASVA